jgi:flagellar basal body-associated protein FliL
MWLGQLEQPSLSMHENLKKELLKKIDEILKKEIKHSFM